MYRLKWWALLALAAITLALTACGASHTATVLATSPQQAAAARSPVPATTKAQVSVSCPPAPGEGVLGACTPKPVQVFGTKIVPVDPAAPASIPDVSSWQGNVNWPAVKAWQVARRFTPGGIFKMGEYVLDPYAARNNAQLRSLGMWRAGYWFIRNTGCGHEAGQIVAEARALGLRVVFLDDEVPEARGYDGCLTPALKGAGLIVGEYASPGSYPGGARSDNAAWMAAYGPSNPPSAPWGGPIKAFQCTDGVFGCITTVSGLGRVDMSVDYGITKLGVATVTKAHLICFGPKWKRGSATCKRVRPLVAKWSRARDSTKRVLAWDEGILKAYRCVKPYRRGVCIHAGRLDATFTQREQWFASQVVTTLKQYT